MGPGPCWEGYLLPRSLGPGLKECFPVGNAPDAPTAPNAALVTGRCWKQNPLGQHGTPSTGLDSARNYHCSFQGPLPIFLPPERKQ